MAQMAWVLFLAFLVIPALSFAETIDVLIKGVDDGVRTNKQQDYKEASMNAKLEAIERAGVAISSITNVTDGKLKFDVIESKAEAVLVPGFTIMDMGYQTDGTYQVVLVGKVNTVSEGVENKQLRYAANLIKRGKGQEASQLVDKILDTSTDDDAVAEALFCKVVWGFSYDHYEILERLRSFYPNSKYLSLTESYLNIGAQNNKTHKIELSSGVFDKKTKTPIINRPVILTADGWKNRSEEIRIELLAKNNEVFVLKIKAFATGFRFDDYQKDVRTNNFDYNFDIDYSFFMNDKLIGSPIQRTRRAGWQKKPGLMLGYTWDVQEGPDHSNIDTELIEYPAKIRLKGEGLELVVTIETLMDALPQPLVQ